MTPSERLRLAGERLYGSRWQTAMARSLGVSDRRVRQWLAGDPVPAGIWRDLERIEIERRGWPRDEWLIASDGESRREYVVHTRAPRFVARMAHDGDADADLVTGITYACRGGEMLCEIAWIDPAPASEPELLDLFQRVETAIAIDNPVIVVPRGSTSATAAAADANDGHH